MKFTVGIRKETKDNLEHRAPLAPRHIKEITKNYGLKFIVEPAKQRKYSNEEYKEAGAEISSDLARADLILGVKEVPIADLIPDKPFIFFSHTIKGQKYNMPLLKEILEQKITLMDYELVRDVKGRRTIFFGHFAGYAGMIDTLWLLGQRLKYEGYSTPFERIKQAIDYNYLTDAEKEIIEVGELIKKDGLPEELSPLIVGFTGRGNVSKGAQKIFDLLPVEKITPEEVPAVFENGYLRNKVYSVEYYSPDIYERLDGKEYEREHFHKNPHSYKSKFEKNLEYLTALVNGIYWEPDYDRLVTKKYFKDKYSEGKKPRLRVIGDITCDIEGSIELTVKNTRYDNPAFVYEPLTDKIIDGWEGEGVVILAVDKLPTELAKEATESFGDELAPHIPALANINYSLPFEELKAQLPQEFRGAVIAHQGKLTEDFQYLKEFL